MTDSARHSRTASVIERRLLVPLRDILAWGPGVDGRLIVLLMVAAYLAAIAWGRLVWDVDMWPALGVPSGPSLFFDARNLTAAWECHRLGYDTLYENPCDPWGRPLNYLRPWLFLSLLGLNQSHTLTLGVALVGAMFVSFVLLSGRMPGGTGAVLGLAACSPAVMLAVERANLDLAMFSLVAAASLFWRAAPAPGRVVSPILLLLGALGKVYPAFALPAFIAARNRVATRVSLLCLAAFGVYLAFSVRDVVHAAQVAPQGEHFAYGARILPAHLYHQVGADRWAGPAVIKQMIAVVPLLLMAGAGAWLVRRRLTSSDDQSTTVAATPLVALHCGALVYLGTFAVGNNYDYRLVFLLLTLPQLVEWVHTPVHPLSSLASATLVAILGLLWVGSLSEPLALWDEIASWIVAGLLAALCAATLPRLSMTRGALCRDPGSLHQATS